MLHGADPWKIPKYPQRPAVSPSVAPSTFSAGPSYDWENPTTPPEQLSTANFANTRSFEETSAWIKKTIENYTATRKDRIISDFHFRGCVIEWHEEQPTGSDHINEYNHSVNLGDVDIDRGAVQIFRESVRLRWDMQTNRMLGRYWDKSDGAWTLLGERSEQDSGAEFFLQRRDDIMNRLGYAFIHAARLCGAKAKPVR